MQTRPDAAIDGAASRSAEHGLRLVLAAAVVLAGACGGSDRQEPSSRAGEGTPGAEAGTIRGLDTLASGLEVPWGVDFAPDGRIFVTERPGRIRIVDDGGLRPEPWARIDVVPPEFRSEGGLLGLALSPDFEETGHVFVVATFRTEVGLENRILRFTEEDGRGTDRTLVVDDLPGPRTEPGAERAIHTHVGGALSFGPDGNLHVSTGDATYPDRAQDTASLAGKILRYAPDGSVPADNPISGSPVYALGVRNPTGMTWLPRGDLLVTDHGPSELSWEPFSGWFGDELNVIRPGRNYGWPEAVGDSAGGGFVPALQEWSPSIAPAGVAIHPAGSDGSGPTAVVASLRGQHLRRLGLARAPESPVGWRVEASRRLLEGRIGRIRPVVVGPDGSLYIGSSNRDSRGNPRSGDDHLYRVRFGR